MFAHRIIEAFGQTERQNAGLLNVLPELIDEPVEPLIARNISNRAMKFVVSFEVLQQIAFLAGLF